MLNAINQKLELANKMIFVKKYNEAFDILSDLSKSVEGRSEFLIHIRYIELAFKLDKLSQLHKVYSASQKDQQLERLFKVCTIIIEQYQNIVTTDKTIQKLHKIIKDYGEDACIYFALAACQESQGNLSRAKIDYEKSLALDPNLYSNYFGLSQLCYQTGNAEDGDKYFYIFEQSAPYNVYGNFETHHKLYKEFMHDKQYEEAKAAVETLTEWWIDHKGFSPPEVNVFENLAMSEILSVSGDQEESLYKKEVAVTAVEEILQDPSVSEGVLYFLAKLLESYSEKKLALSCYKKLLRLSTSNPTVVQTVGFEFLNRGDFVAAKDLFLDAYEVHPDNEDVRFCILLSKLKIESVNVEEYLAGKDRLRKLAQEKGDKVEILTLLHSLYAKFKDDPEVHQHMGDIYFKIDNKDRAIKHFERMYELDPKGTNSILSYACFLIQYYDCDEKALSALSELSHKPNLSKDHRVEVNWLKAMYYAKKKDFIKSQEYTTSVLADDPWNVSFIVQDIVNLTEMLELDDPLKEHDPVIQKLSVGDDNKLNWSAFGELTTKLESAKVHNITYSRKKLNFLYFKDSEEHLQSLVKTACIYDSQKAIYEFLRLLNTNFDSPAIYTALGVLCKELWQLQSACMWFEQSLQHRHALQHHLSKNYLELADCLVWVGKDLNKAIEYAKLSLDMGGFRSKVKALITMSHAYLKLGQLKQAQTYIADISGEDIFEVKYLLGLMEYRNGAHRKAKEIWKPLLKVNTQSLREHHIKQEILKYYFNEMPYASTALN